MYSNNNTDNAISIRSYTHITDHTVCVDCARFWIPCIYERVADAVQAKAGGTVCLDQQSGSARRRAASSRCSYGKALSPRQERLGRS